MKKRRKRERERIEESIYMKAERESVCERRECVRKRERERGGGLQERCVLLLLLIQACSGTEVLTQHRL